MYSLGIDIGGSALKAAPVDTRSGAFLAPRHKVETPDCLSATGMVEAIQSIVKHFAWTGPIGIGFPGVILDGRVVFMGNLDQSMLNWDLRAAVREATGCVVGIVNDADAAGSAEMAFGAGRDLRGTVLLLTLGTGVGSAVFNDGVLMPNTEFGQLPINGVAAEKIVAASVKDKKRLSWEEWAPELNSYLQAVETMLWPTKIIIGGGISQDYEKFFPLLQTRTELVPAQMKNDAGIIGAALAGAAQVE